MLFIFSTPVLIRHLRQHKTVVFLHWCLLCAVVLIQHHSKLACLSPSVTSILVKNLQERLQPSLKILDQECREQKTLAYFFIINYGRKMFCRTGWRRGNAHWQKKMFVCLNFTFRHRLQCVGRLVLKGTICPAPDLPLWPILEPFGNPVCQISINSLYC